MADPPSQNSELPVTVIVGAGGAGTIEVIKASDESLAQPLASVINTLKLPASVTRILCVVSPVDQCHVLAFPASNWMLSPSQKAVSPEVITGLDGSEKTTVLVTLEVGLVHPFASVISTL